jgi:hypothetical protein
MSVFAASIKRLFVVSAILTLTACGGGGGGGGAPDPGQAGGMSVSPTSLAFTAQSNAAPPASQTITLSITASDAAYVIAGVPSGSTLPSWLSIAWANSPGANVLNVSITTTGLSPGTRTATLRLGITRADKSLIAYRDVAVTYTVTSNISATPAALSFTQFIGSTAAAAQTLNISDNGGGSYPWSASVSYQSGSGWLTLGAGSGGSLPAAISVGVNPNAAPGTYNATITASGNGDSVSIPVSYSVRAPGLVPSQASVSFSARNAQTSLPTPIDVPVSAENGATLSYVATVTYGAGSSGWLTATGSAAPGILSIAPSTINLAAGTYTATVTLTPSNGANATSIGVSYTVQASTISVNPAQVSFNAFSGQASLPTAAGVATSVTPGDSVPYTTSITYGAGASGWLSTTGNTAPGTLSIAPSTTNLAAGTYTATVRLTPSTGAGAINVGVTYTLATSSLTLNPTSTTFTIDPTSTAIPSILNRSVSLGSTGAPLTWTATSSDPWLTISPASGTSGTTATLSLVPAQIDALEAGTRSATITFSYSPPSGNPASATLVATLNLQLPKVNFVAPYVAQPNTSKEVIVRGSGFNSATGLNVMFGSNAVSTYTVVSDTEIRVTHPSLAAGSYQVRIPNLFGINRSRASLVVVEPQAYGAVAYASAGTKSRIIYDDERHTIYVANAGAVTIERYVYDANISSWAYSSLSLPQFRDVALSPDGAQLVAVSDATVRVIDPATLTQTGQTSFTNNFGGFYYLNQIAFANNGKAIVATGLNGSGFTTTYLYDMLVPSLTSLTSAYFAPVGASADGSRVVFGDAGISPAQLVRFYSASTGTVVSSAAARNVGNIVLNRTASRTVLNRVEVFDSGFTLLGNLPGTTLAVVLSPDGTIAYTHDSGGKVRKFDLTGALVAGYFPEVGTGTTPPASPGTSSMMTISLDGGSLFIAGNQNVVMMPAP